MRGDALSKVPPIGLVNERLFYSTFAAGADHSVWSDINGLSDHENSTRRPYGVGFDESDDDAEWGGGEGEQGKFRR